MHGKANFRRSSIRNVVSFYMPNKLYVFFLRFPTRCEAITEPLTCPVFDEHRDR